MKIVSASGNPSGVHVVLQNAGVTHGGLPSAVLQDVAAWRSSMLTRISKVGAGAGTPPSQCSSSFDRRGVESTVARSVL